MLEITGRLVAGHRVASGQSKNTPYPQGTLAMQAPLFAQAGLDLGNFHLGTLNVDIKRRFALHDPDYTFPLLKWSDIVAAESFSFYPCQLGYAGQSYDAYIYYVHPETKQGHFQKDGIIEIITEHIRDIDYDDVLTLRVASKHFQWLDDENR